MNAQRRGGFAAGRRWPVAAGALAAVLLLAVAACSSSSGGALATDSSLASTPTSGTPSSTTAVPTTTTSSTTSTTTPAPTTLPGNPNGPVVVPDGAVLTAISPAPAPVAFPAGSTCTVLPGATAASDATHQCGSPGSGTGTAASPGLAWVLAPTPQGGTTVTVYRVVDGKAQAVLAATDANGTAWAHVTVAPVALTGVPGAALAVGFRTTGSAGQLQLDVVSPDGTVAFHRELDQGKAEFAAGQEQDWAARFGPTDPNCCPSAYEHSVVRFVNGHWRVVITETIPAASVPKGQFP